jgi:hypothetical protein
MLNEFIVLVIMDILDFTNARRQDHAATDNTGIMGYVCTTSIAGNPTFGAIRHRILFGVNGGLFVPFADD